jgi:hypothetical protein
MKLEKDENWSNLQIRSDTKVEILCIIVQWKKDLEQDNQQTIQSEEFILWIDRRFLFFPCAKIGRRKLKMFREREGKKYGKNETRGYVEGRNMEN